MIISETIIGNLNDLLAGGWIGLTDLIAIANNTEATPTIRLSAVLLIYEYMAEWTPAQRDTIETTLRPVCASARLILGEIASSFECPVCGHDSRTHTTTQTHPCLLYTSPSPRDGLLSRMPSSA